MLSLIKSKLDFGRLIDSLSSKTASMIRSSCVTQCGLRLISFDCHLHILSQLHLFLGVCFVLILENE